ncbi:hypothetical protein KVH22_21640 [Streptomyces olivaceus]|uniref:hypothetical protein n=1 Tax=Streptomyces olivaceus TaxID=47716 RepID=UPI001CCE6A3B|nr:hypothetical protein [Streptomyces olivaceus]MBZ6258122.1 hypothetical protein [Streptomyces olivaceus]
MRSAWLLPGGSEPGQTREDTRLSPLGTYAPESELRTRDGVIAGGTPFAASGAGAMALQIGVGRAVVQGTDAQGAYPVCLDAPTTITFPDGDAQFTRIDTVAVHVYDGLYDVDGQTLAQIERVPGDATSDPQAPDMPSGYLRLWDVTVPAGASAGVGGIDWSSALADRRRYTAAYGGIIPRGTGLQFDGSYDGQYRDTGTDLERWNAAAGVWEVYTPSTVQWTEWVPLTSIAALGAGVSPGSATPEVRDVVIGGSRTREFRGAVSTSGVGTAAFLLWSFHTGYRPTYERDYSVAGIPGNDAYRLYMSTSGNVGTTGHPTGQTSLTLDQIRIGDAPGAL